MNRNPHNSRLPLCRYGDFTLTEAVRPAPNVPMVPAQGYRLESFRDPQSRTRIPMLAAAASSEILFDVFLNLLEPLGRQAHVVLETSHECDADEHVDMRRSHIDLPVLLSHFCEFEDLLLNDGCTGIAVISVKKRIEIQLDEHKLLFVYAQNLLPFRKILRSHGIRRKDHLLLIAEAEHLHHSTEEYADDFQRLCRYVGAGHFEGVFSDDNTI